MRLNYRIPNPFLLCTAVLAFFALFGTAAAAPVNGYTGANATFLAKRGDGYKNVVYYADWYDCDPLHLVSSANKLTGKAIVATIHLIFQ